MSAETQPQELIFTDQLAHDLESWLAHTPHSRLFLFIDNKVAGLHGSRLERLAADRITVMPGEDNKTLSTVQDHYLFLHDRNADRQALILAVGGGLTTDLVGFVAATWKRGIRYASVPTTLLAMVDAAVGGKTGVNFLGVKNAVGAFHTPLASFYDPAFLSTLPQRELLAGFAEVLKHGLIADPAYWQEVTSAPLEAQDWMEVVRRSVAIKQQVVEKDPLEGGYRKILNFGHTVGHALESLSHFQNTPLLHGEAVALGMMAEAWLSVEFAGLPGADAEHILQTLRRYPFPHDFWVADPDRFLQYLMADKKNQSGEVKMALLNRIGKCKPVVSVPVDAVLGVLQVLFEGVVR